MKACCSIINVCMCAPCSWACSACEQNFIIPSPMLIIQRWETSEVTPKRQNKSAWTKMQIKTVGIIALALLPCACRHEDARVLNHLHLQGLSKKGHLHDRSKHKCPSYMQTMQAHSGTKLKFDRLNLQAGRGRTVLKNTISLDRWLNRHQGLCKTRT